MQIAKMLRPLVAGICLARLGPTASYSTMAGVYACGLLVSGGLIGRLGGPGGAASASVGASLRAGLLAAWSNPTVRGVLLVIIAMNTIFFPYQHTLPVFARDVLAVGPLSGSRSFVACIALMVVMGAAESAFAAMQSTLVLVSAPERVRGGAMVILSACIGTQPLGTLTIGLLGGAVGAPQAFAINALVALLVIVPLAVPLVRRG